MIKRIGDVPPEGMITVASAATQSYSVGNLVARNANGYAILAGNTEAALETTLGISEYLGVSGTIDGETKILVVPILTGVFCRADTTAAPTQAVVGTLKKVINDKVDIANPPTATGNIGFLIYDFDASANTVDGIFIVK